MNHCKFPVPLILSCLATAAVWIAGSAPAGAASPETERQVTVHYGDLDLASVAGATQLYERLRTAARQVCGEPGLTLGEQHAWQVCFEGSVEQAVTAVGNPIVSALAAGRDYRSLIALNR
ncbi:MAG: UrcA family protein [Proteobacteria bacterium]|nr:UrcA family protein [Pseudomonadota bacterium]